MMRSGRLILYAVLLFWKRIPKKKTGEKTALQCRGDSSEMRETGNVLCVL